MFHRPVLASRFVVVIRASLIIFVAILLGSCSLQKDDWRRIAEESGAKEYARIILNDKLDPYGGIEGLRDIATVREVLELLAQVIDDVWGEQNEEVPSEKRYVKYSNDYQARAIVDFEQGYLRVETIAESDAETLLAQALVLAFLTPKNLSLEDIFTDKEPQLGEEPFLYEQILDNNSQPIRAEPQAERYARYLVANSAERYVSDGRTITAVQTELVAEHLHLRQLQFSDSVLRYAREYGVSPSLVYAVIEIESAFNPFAVSHANALGLMQIVPATAGRDVFERIKEIPGEPTRDELFVADFNIDIGAAYLYILDNIYLQRIIDAESRRYAKISAYNGGSGNVFRTFSDNREQAIRQINALSPEQVYSQLVRNHPFAETRNYLQKVRDAEYKYL